MSSISHISGHSNQSDEMFDDFFMKSFYNINLIITNKKGEEKRKRTGISENLTRDLRKSSLFKNEMEKYVNMAGSSIIIMISVKLLYLCHNSFR